MVRARVWLAWSCIQWSSMHVHEGMIQQSVKEEGSVRDRLLEPDPFFLQIEKSK